MTEIILHIGISKTGSSAIQYGLAQGREALAAEGVHYAATGADEVGDTLKISSGNGAGLAKRLMAEIAGGSAEFGYGRAAFDAEYLGEEPRALISSEGLANALPERLAAFRAEVVQGRPVRVVAFVRDLYGHAVSSWMQRVKRHGYTDDFLTFCREKYSNKQCAALRTYAGVFGPGAITVLPYRPDERPVFDAFLEAVQVAWRPSDPPPQINRSLSAVEADVLRQCNAVLRKRAFLSQLISDHLITSHPDKSKADVANPQAARLLTRKYADDVAWVNETFFGGKPVLGVGGPTGHVAAADEREADVLLDAVNALGLEIVRLRALNGKLRTAQTELKQKLADEAAAAKPGRPRWGGR